MKKLDLKNSINKINNKKNFIDYLVVIYFIITFASFVIDRTIFVYLKLIISIWGYLVLLVDRDKIKSNRYILAYLVFMLISGILTFLINGNMDLLNIIYSAAIYGGITILLLNTSLNIKHMWLLFVFQIVYYIFTISQGIQPNDIFIGRSRNYITIYLLFFLALLYFAYEDKNKDIGIFAITISFLLSIWANGRSGMIVMVALLFGTIFLNILKTDKKKYSIHYKYIIALSIIFLLICISIVFNTDALQMIFDRFYSEGLDTPRTSIWGSYIKNMTTSLKSFLFGFNLENSDEVFRRYNLNLHNSFLNIHAYYGLPFFLLNIYLLIKTFIFYIKKKRYKISLFMMFFFLRAATDHVFSIYHGDIFLYYFAWQTLLIEGKNTIERT